jgi:hypothetical protein
VPTKLHKYTLRSLVKCIKGQNQEINKLKKALNRIGILTCSELAYTSEFTERVKGIVSKALTEVEK